MPSVISEGIFFGFYYHKHIQTKDASTLCDKNDFPSDMKQYFCCLETFAPAT